MIYPHGSKSKLLVPFFVFVVAFGGALLAAIPAQASPGDMSCFVEVTISPSPSSSPTAVPTTPTPCPSPSPAVTVTVTKTVIVTKTVKGATEIQIVTVTQDPIPSSTTTPPQPSHTVLPLPAEQSKKDSSGHSSLMPWGIGLAGVGGTVLAVLGITGITRRRRYQGVHHDSSAETQIVPVVKGDDYSVSDYNPKGGYDPALGGRAGESYRGGSDTEEMPSLKEDPPAK